MKRAQQSQRVGVTVAIIGPGRLGQALGRLLVDAGVPVRYVAARRPAATRRAIRFIGSGQAVGLGASELADAAVILITTSDGAIGEVARKLARLRRDWTGKVVLHTCGALPAAVLRPLQRRGAAIGALHPFQTIPNAAAGVRSLRGGFWGIEGDVEAVRVAKRWVSKLGGVAFHVRPKQKTLYHAAAFLTCPTVVTLMNNSARLLRLTGVPAKTVRPMLHRFVAQTAENFSALGAKRALTGPAVRGDWSTIRKHLRALRRSAPASLARCCRARRWPRRAGAIRPE